MRVGCYRKRDKNRNKVNYKFKDSYIFLKQYFKDGMPYSVNNNGLHCKSGKRRSYHDLCALAQAHSKKFSIKSFNKNLIKVIHELKLGFTYCPWVCTIVFYNGGCAVRKRKKNEYYILASNFNQLYSGKDKYRFFICEEVLINYLKFNKPSLDKKGNTILISELTKRKRK